MERTGTQTRKNGCASRSFCGWGRRSNSSSLVRGRVRVGGNGGAAPPIAQREDGGQREQRRGQASHLADHGGEPEALHRLVVGGDQRGIADDGGDRAER